MKKLMTIAGLLLMASLASAQTPTFLKGSFDEALGLAKKQNKPILVDFHQRGG
jgi:hypothetical protein